jgi:superfamily I DNA/RNA helicase
MATLIPGLGTCVSRMTSGERRLAMDLCASALAQRKLPHRARKRTGEYQPGADTIQVMTMKVSKELEFPVVALPGVGHMPAPGEDEKDAARVFYVAATRATQRLVIAVSGNGGFGNRIFNAL